MPAIPDPLEELSVCRCPELGRLADNVHVLGHRDGCPAAELPAPRPVWTPGGWA